MKITFEIEKIVVLITHGKDQIFIHTKDCPSPFPPDVYPEPLRLKFDTRKGSGVDYVRETFGIEPEVMDVS